jgi:hypothetical protein
MAGPRSDFQMSSGFTSNPPINSGGFYSFAPTPYSAPYSAPYAAPYGGGFNSNQVQFGAPVVQGGGFQPKF